MQSTAMQGAMKPPSADRGTGDIQELESFTRSLAERLNVLERQHEEVNRAFPANDIARPDYDGHRRAHLKMEKANELMESYKVGVTKQILSAAVVFLLGLLSSGGIQWITRVLSGVAK